MMSHADLAYNRGLRYAREGRLNEAQALLREALRRDPSHHIAQNVLGKVYLHLGDLDAAQTCWERVLDQHPNDATAQACLHTLQRARRRWRWRAILTASGLASLLLALMLIIAQLPLVSWTEQGVSLISQLPSKLRAQPIVASNVRPDSGGTPPFPAGPSAPPPPPSEAVPPATETPPTQEAPVSQAQGPPSSSSTEISEVKSSPGGATPAPLITRAAEIPKVYQQALRQLRLGHPEAAIPKFQAILDAGFPSPLLDNAQYWLGESYAAQGRYAEALEAFRRVEFLPDGNKSHDAQIRLRKIQRLVNAGSGL